MLPSSFETGWCPPSTSTMLSQRAPMAAPGETWVPRSFGPRWVIVSVIRSRTSSATSLGSPRSGSLHKCRTCLFPTVVRCPRRAAMDERSRIASGTPDQMARVDRQGPERDAQRAQMAAPRGGSSARQRRASSAPQRDAATARQAAQHVSSCFAEYRIRLAARIGQQPRARGRRPPSCSATAAGTKRTSRPEPQIRAQTSTSSL